MLTAGWMQTALQDISGELQLLPYEDRRPCPHRGELSGRGCHHREPRRDRRELCHCEPTQRVLVLCRALISASSQGKFAIIKDCAKIADNTIVPPNTVIPALALFAGSPGQ